MQSHRGADYIAGTFAEVLGATFGEQLWEACRNRVDLVLGEEVWERDDAVGVELRELIGGEEHVARLARRASRDPDPRAQS
jgi:hypothetical protein